LDAVDIEIHRKGLIMDQRQQTFKFSIALLSSEPPDIPVSTTTKTVDILAPIEGFRGKALQR
jgi:hypothetical protein